VTHLGVRWPGRGEWVEVGVPAGAREVEVRPDGSVSSR
jgi:hypothetical protein